MKLWLRIICSVCLLLSLVPVSSTAGPWGIRGKWRAFSSRVCQQCAKRKLALSRIFSTKRKTNYESFKRPHEKLDLKGISNANRFAHEKTGLEQEAAQAAEQAIPAIPEPRKVVEMKFEHPTPQEPSFVTLADIEAHSKEMELWELDPEADIATHTQQVISNYLFERDTLRDAQNFLIENPFEKTPMDEIYLESDVVFANLPEGNLPIDYRFLSIEQQVDEELKLQENFYFEEFPNSSLLLVRGRIRPVYLQKSTYFYVLILTRPNRPLYQKIRALTMLGFLGRKGDGLADVILESLKNDFKDPPWTVDYAAGMALLNLGEVEKFDQLVQWRRRIEAGKSQRTPGISWLYRDVFGDYDLYVQELGEGMPYMRPDTPEEWAIATRQLEDIRQHATSMVEEFMWKLESVEDLVEFLDWKGSILRIRFEDQQ